MMSDIRRGFVGIAILILPLCSAQTITSIAGRTPHPCVSAGNCAANPPTPSKEYTLLVPSALTPVTNNGRVFTFNGVGTGLPVAANSVQFAVDNTIGSFACTALTTLPQITPTSSTAFTLTDNTATWGAHPREFETPRALCVSFNGLPSTFTGFYVRPVWNCGTGRICGPNTIANPNARDFYYATNSITDQQRAVELAETTCCSDILTGIGQCINTNVSSCCRNAAITPVTEVCCPNSVNTIVAAEQNCPCTRSSSSTDCPSGTTCCLPSKYVATYPTLAVASDTGLCYNPSTTSCCNTGSIYDPGSSQCCSINGVQSLDIPCPCNLDSDCAGGSGTPLTNMACCKQVQPALTQTVKCDIFSNFPSGTGDYSTQRCPGTCINTNYQICCNGVTCVSRYEKCCNATCCNKFDGTCTEAFRPGARGFSANWQSYGIQYTQCTTLEAMSPLKAFWAFIVPTSLLAIMFGGLAFVMVFATRVTRKFSWVERLTIFVAFFSILFGFPTFFAPVWKYGVVITLVGLFAIITAAARLKWLNIVLVILCVVELIYLYDPWNGNAYLTLALDRNPNGGNQGQSAGILHSIQRMYPNVRGDVARIRYCTDFYDFFRNDPALRDTERHDNPLVVTFGYCSRAWTYALLMFEGITLIWTGVLFFLAVISLVLRFKDDRGYDPIELEVRGQGSKIGSYYN
eukprot:TRINITY_DN14_c1_g1_i1.p1 TRINITY_DN14_c1_g1~~TRINITY_DN14_c1_g1_i1.p1  ORF type:complete len:687 (+),score=131.05 TRINITY_DN14_c1_g1_i1:903-2963(+)